MIRGTEERGKGEQLQFEKSRFVIDRYNLGLKKLSNNDQKIKK